MDEKHIENKNDLTDNLNHDPNENIVEQYPEAHQEDIKQSLDLTEDEVFNFIFKLLV